MSFARINDNRLYYELAGESGDPIVLIHGSWSDSGGWDYLVPLLSDSFKVLRYDRRGHTRSDEPEGWGTIKDDISDLAGLIRQHGLAPAHIVGNSFGGNIALGLAAEDPELINTLIVHEPPAVLLLDNPENRHILEELDKKMKVVLQKLENGFLREGARYFMENVVFWPGFWDELPEETHQKFVDNANTFLEEQKDPDWMKIDTEALSGFTRPTLLTFGEKSDKFFRIILEKLEEIIPGSKFRELANMGHVPQTTHPQKYADILKSFIAGSD